MLEENGKEAEAASKWWLPGEGSDSDESPGNPFTSFFWMEGDSLAPPCQAEMDVVDRILDLVNLCEDDHIFDLGCGDGRIPLRAASRFGCKGTGIEIEAKEAAKFRAYIGSSGLSTKVTCIEGDLRTVDLSEASVVVTYLLPEAMEEISSKLKEALQRGCRVVCNTWGISSPEVVATRRETIGNISILLYSPADSPNPAPKKIKANSLKEGYASFTEHWSPRLAGQINDMHLKLVKVQGTFVWHHHDVQDELFLVTKGCLQMGLRDPEERWETVDEGSFIIVPKGIEHCPRAEEECEVILLEPAGTLNTGNLKDDEKTKAILETLYD